MAKSKAKAVASPMKNEDSSFIKLPNEIRNMIYELLDLKLGKPIKVSPPKKTLTNERSRKRRKYHRTGILRVNKQINSEASPIFFHLNKFLIGNSPDISKEEPNLEGLKQFIARVPARNIAAIVNVELTCHFDPHRVYNSNSEWLAMTNMLLKHFTGVRVLRLEVTNWLTTWHNVAGQSWWPINTHFDHEQRSADNRKTITKMLRIWLNSSAQHQVLLTDTEISKLRKLLDPLVEEQHKIKTLLREYDEKMKKK
ncbi:hypothetical protein BDZ45DRAFT_725517 [Acephala macrosclerotiorum]|nr:hypothetical protein BDZ45DRAFT_725517 [Acephala macrosclerotiorum]